MQIGSSIFWFKPCRAWRKGSESGWLLQRWFGGARLGDTLKDVISTSAGLRSPSKQTLCRLTPAGCSESLAASENGRLLEKQIQFTLTCKLGDRTASCFFGFTDMCICGQSQVHVSVLSGCQQLHLGIGTVPPSSQDLALSGKRGKDGEPSKSPQSH